MMKYILFMIIYTLEPLLFTRVLEKFPDSACYKLIKNIVKNELNKIALQSLEHVNWQTYPPIFIRLYDCKS